MNKQWLIELLEDGHGLVTINYQEYGWGGL